jgi:peptidoglycan hydrolase-like protein with peptidoglycan-binding domain
MTHLTDVQVARYAKNAGFHDLGLVISIAICLAESGGVTDAVNITGNKPKTSRDRGLWQINDYWHPEVSDAEAFDAAQNARETFRISKSGTDWHEWATYNHGTYLKNGYIERARIAAAIVEGGPFVLRRLLKNGVKGEDVMILQAKVKVTQDGDFGPKTEAAVKAWQRAHHLDPDGIVGPLTARSLGWAWAG